MSTIQARETNEGTVYVLTRDGKPPLEAHWPHPLLELEPDAQWLPSIDEGWAPRSGLSLVVAHDPDAYLYAKPPKRTHWPTLLEGRKRQPGFISEEELRDLHAKHWAHNVPITQIARENWERWGFSSARSCCSSIFGMFRARGMNAQSRGRMSNISRSMRLPGETRDQFKARRRRERGFVLDVKCKGVRQSYPRKGQPCERPATIGSDYCVSHDPAKKQWRESNLERHRRPKEPYWTVTLCLEAALRFKRRHGRWPVSDDGTPDNGMPTFSVPRKLFGGWPAYIAAAKEWEHERTGRRDATHLTVST